MSTVVHIGVVYMQIVLYISLGVVYIQIHIQHMYIIFNYEGNVQFTAEYNMHHHLQQTQRYGGHHFSENVEILPCLVHLVLGIN